MNPDFHFVLAMDVIVCTAGVGNVLRTSVCMSPTVLETEVLWSGQKYVMMVALSSKLFKEHRNTETIFFILSFCPFRNSKTSINMTMRDVTWLVFGKALWNRIISVFFPDRYYHMIWHQLNIYGINSVDVFATVKSTGNTIGDAWRTYARVEQNNILQAFIQ